MSKKIIKLLKIKFAFLLICLSINTSVAQRNVVLNLPAFDKDFIHFGFYVALNNLGGKLTLNDQLLASDTIFGVNLKSYPGFTLGVVTNLHIGESWDLRAMFPSLVFGQRDFVYKLRNEQGRFFEDKRIIESTYLSIPMELRYKSDRYGNFRTFVMAGGDISYDMVSQKNVAESDKSVIRLNRWDYSYMVGFGCEFFLEYFKFTPQLKWNFGLTNLLINDGTPFTNVIDQMKSRLFSISITFEG